MVKQKENKETVVEIEDENLLQILIPLFFEEAKYILDEDRA